MIYVVLGYVFLKEVGRDFWIVFFGNYIIKFFNWIVRIFIYELKILLVSWWEILNFFFKFWNCNFKCNLINVNKICLLMDNK